MFFRVLKNVIHRSRVAFFLHQTKCHFCLQTLEVVKNVLCSFQKVRGLLIPGRLAMSDIITGLIKFRFTGLCVGN